MAEFAAEHDGFLLLAHEGDDLPALHHRFLDRRSPLPLHHTWAEWLWQRGLSNGEITPLQSSGIAAYVCNPDGESLREDLSRAVAMGLLSLPDQPEPGIQPRTGVATP